MYTYCIQKKWQRVVIKVVAKFFFWNRYIFFIKRVYLSILVEVKDKCQTQFQLIHQIVFALQFLQISLEAELIVVKFWFENIADFHIKSTNLRANKFVSKSAKWYKWGGWKFANPVQNVHWVITFCLQKLFIYDFIKLVNRFSWFILPLKTEISFLLMILSLWYFLKIIDVILEKIRLALSWKFCGDVFTIFEANNISLDLGP